MPPIKKTVKGFTGIGPQSGLGRAFGARIQRGRFLGWMGLGPRVLKFDGLSGRGWWWRLRRKFYKAAFGGPPPPLRGPPPPDERWEASLKVVVSFSPHKMG